jgi:hypothetical protein
MFKGGNWFIEFMREKGRGTMTLDDPSRNF